MLVLRDQHSELHDQDNEGIAGCADTVDSQTEAASRGSQHDRSHRPVCMLHLSLSAEIGRGCARKNAV